MIASLDGTLRRKSPQSVIIDVHGVGYEVLTPSRTAEQLGEPGRAVHLWTYTHVREDALQLYGFLSEAEKTVFLLLMTVSGIGPRLALGMLSGLALPDLVSAVRTGNAARLSAVPGIGKKTADRLVLELKEKILTVAMEPSAGAGTPAEGGGDSGRIEDVVSALVNLGYKPPMAREAVKQVLKAANGASGREGAGLEDLIKESLKVLSRT